MVRFPKAEIAFSSAVLLLIAFLILTHSVALAADPPTDISYEALYDKVSRLISLHKENEAIKTLNEIIKIAPNDSQEKRAPQGSYPLRAYALLGDLYYKQDQLPEAIFAWNKILEKEPTNAKIQALLEKAQREQKTHTTFTHESTRHFTIKFEGAENRGLYKFVLDTLETAYGEVGRALLFYPTEEVIVFLYTGQEFFDVTRAPSWSGGVFDGKMRIPTKGFETQTDPLRRILFHEYVHAVIQQMTDRGVAKTGETMNSSVPVWLHEGVAQYFEPFGSKNEGRGMLKALVQQKGKEGIIPLSQLQGSFMGINDPLTVRLAYEESLSAVQFLVGRFGIWRLKMLLEDLAVKQDIEEAMQSALLISYKEFESRWLEGLE
ncbi:MAG: tetratricopeptide repeat protein [Nitrospirae bacterium]|nr:tetratricopeptide repeat protein [Candidatus Troglogloeales bacterium]